MAIDNYPKPRLPISNAMWLYNAVGGETILSGYDSKGQPLQYTVNSEQLFLNGVMLVRGVDYAATTGTTITGLTALSAGDFVEILTYSNFNISTVPAPNITGKVLNSQLDKSSVTLGNTTVNLGDTVSSVSGLTIDGLTNVIHTNRGATTPTTGQVAGDIFWDTTATALKLWNGSAWISFAPPGTPSGVVATDLGASRLYGNSSAASIAFTPNNTAGVATQFFVTSTPGSFLAYGNSSPIVMTGLTTSTQYTFTVTAQGSFGNSSPSASSGPVTVTSVPQAPTIGTATAGLAQASVAFTAGATGGSAITSYTVTSTPGNVTATGASSPIVVTGLSGGVPYTFAVTATNANGTSLSSSGSNSVTPQGSVDTTFIVVGGGGAGSSSHGGGGGAGGVIQSTFTAGTGALYPVTIGGGGSCPANSSAAGTNGSPSSIFGNSAGGGGGAGAGYSSSSTSGLAGSATNGNGGGAGGGSAVGTGGAGNGPSAFAGGNSVSTGGVAGAGGGGGGAGGVGANATGAGSGSATGGVGGIGINWLSRGTYYAGGGGGGGWTTTGANGGTGGGGKAGNPGQSGGVGSPNTGGGGGGAGDASAGPGGNGGSGVIVIRYTDTRTITFGSGVTGTESAASGGYKFATITAGSGNVSWN